MRKWSEGGGEVGGGGGEEEGGFSSMVAEREVQLIEGSSFRESSTTSSGNLKDKSCKYKLQNILVIISHKNSHFSFF